jgi:hypothetical protein
MTQAQLPVHRRHVSGHVVRRGRIFRRHCVRSCLLKRNGHRDGRIKAVGASAGRPPSAKVGQLGSRQVRGLMTMLPIRRERSAALDFIREPDQASNDVDRIVRWSISPVHPRLRRAVWDSLRASRRTLFGRPAAMGRERSTARSAFHVLQRLRCRPGYLEEGPVFGAKSELLGRGGRFQRLLVSASRASGSAFLSRAALATCYDNVSP